MELSGLSLDKLESLPKIGREVLSALFPNKSLETYLIGGGVRDVILGRPTIDIDILIVSEPSSGLELVREILSKRFSKCILTQELTDYLTAKILLGNGTEEIEVDLVFARKEYFPGPGEKAQIDLGTLETDLFRRDFSINALALNSSEDENYQILDAVNGLKDLREKELRVLHANSFVDDPIRILRGIRLGVRLGFEFEEGTLGYLKKSVLEHHMSKVTLGRRIFEIGKFSSEPDPFLLLEKTNEINVLAQSLSLDTVSLSSIEIYRKYTSELPTPLGFWAYILSSIKTLNDDLIAVLPLKKAERKLVFDSIVRGF